MNSTTLRHLFLVLFIVVVWFGVWGLLDEMTDTLEDDYNVKKAYTYLAVLAASLLFIYFRPEILERF